MPLTVGKSAGRKKISRTQLNKGKLLDMMSRSERQLNMEL